MKRGAILLAILVLCVGGVLTLLFYGDGEHTWRRGAASPSELRMSSEDGMAAGAEGASAAAGGAKGTGGIAGDDDPNRVEGPPITIRGVVLRNGKPASNADVVLRRALPRHRAGAYTNDRNQTARQARDITSDKADIAGRFEFKIPRRTSLMVFADAPGAAFAWQMVVVPPKGDPEEITLELGDGRVLAGKVIDKDKKPVADVAVELTLNSSQTPPLIRHATSNEEGLFRFEELRDGSYYITAMPKTHPAERRWVQIPKTSEVLFQLRAGGAIVGRVMNDQGEPIPGAKLSFVTGTSYSGGSGPAIATSDKDGAYRVSQAQPGPVTRILLEHAGYGFRSARNGDIVPPTELVRAGEELRFDITLPRGVTVTGIVVTDGDEAPMAGVAVKLMRMTRQYNSMQDIAVATTDTAGRFVFQHVAEGTYGFEALARFAIRRAQRSANNRKPLTIDFFTDGETPPPAQKVILTGTGTVYGKVEGIDPAAYGGAITVTIHVDEIYRSARTDRTGAFVIEHVPPAQGATAKSNNPSVESEKFDLAAGETTKVLLQPDGAGGFAAIVRDEDGNPLAGALVHAVAEKQIKSQLRNLLYGNGNRRTDAAGRVIVTLNSYQRKQTGKWIVAAVHREHELAMSDPIDLPGEGETIEVELQLEKGGTITGRVEVAGGGSVPNVNVSANPVREKERPFETRPRRSVTTDVDGTFELRGIARDGTYRLSAWMPGGRAEPVEARAGETGIQLIFRATASISGFVVDDEGLPINHGRVTALLPGPKGKPKRKNANISEGRFTLAGLEEGSYELDVSPNRGRYGATTIVFEKKTVGPVRTGTDNYVIEVSYGLRIEGRVIGGGRPVGGASVIAMAPVKSSRRSRSAARPMAVTNGRGEFVIKGLVEGEVELLAMGPGWQPSTLKTSPGGGRITISLEQGETIEGRILKPDGTPLKNQWLRLWPSSKELQAKINAWRQRAGNSYNASGGYNSAGARTDAKGEFRFASLLPGQYRLWLRSEHGVTPQKTLQAGDSNILIQLEPALTIKGTIRDTKGNVPEPTRNNRIWVNAYQGNQSIAGASVLSDGSFEIKGVPAGQLQLRVWAGRTYKYTTVDVVGGDQNVAVVLEKNPPRPRPPGR